MSRTFKDVPAKFRWPKNNRWEKRIAVPYTAIRRDRETGGIKEVQSTFFLDPKGGAKVKRGVINDWWWLRSEPGWWNHMCDEVPARAECRQWEHKAAAYRGDWIDLDTPRHPHSTHCYYW